ncbi:winged helix-turn-helix domain-containing protein [Streptomyces sp. CB01881]|uniref:winged helix-turn-helix domain-containing protein n=1 Tax=Streptomyces sp. CB01881 TaxID=2078691 RepID=UPI000CDC090D|nr:winged helix-turn-helix domain-containing protein [Streptomyces sp. CB01881]AUY52192.1 transcriptional regulator [Streptomyces sp. CB01881]TYC71619.1 ArsR family transcriptional regulator [Streptomyces sp. CB01881]
MLTLDFSAQDLAATRFAGSRVVEVVMSVQVLKDPGAKAVHLPWVRRARERLAAGRVRYELLSQLVPMPAWHLPQFLTALPAATAPGIEAELAALTATAPAVVRAELDLVGQPLPPLVAELYADPVPGLERLAGEVRAYWSAAVEPYWGRIVRLVEGEILYRARRMAADGPAALFDGLHPKVRWQDGRMTVAQQRYEIERRLDGGRGLVLVPSVFIWPGMVWQVEPEGQPGLVYPPRGVATLWESAGATAPDGLAGVLGRTRARLLAELESPASTSELAARTGGSPANVSHHLTALREAGLLARHRTGRTVLYARTEAAELLLRG